MTSEEQLRARVRKIEALFAGATTAGEQVAVETALTRIMARLAEAQRTARSVELQFSIADRWSRQLFLALARRYGLRRYRYPRQRRTAVILQAPDSFLRNVLWPEFEALKEALVGYLAEVTARIIRDEVDGETGEAEERSRAPRLG
jgi:hypothetical protein